MIHEFEEILYLPKWFDHHKNLLISRVPRFAVFFVGLKVNHHKFTLAVFIEFILVYVVLFISIVFHKPFLLSVLIMAFSIHLLIHIIQSILIRKYIPSLLSSLLLFPICSFCIVDLLSSYHLMMSLHYIVLCALGLLFLVFSFLAVYFRRL